MKLRIVIHIPDHERFSLREALDLLRLGDNIERVVALECGERRNLSDDNNVCQGYAEVTDD